jgi:hypothetical protein
MSRQKPAKASVVRQPKKVYCKMIGMGAKSITIVRAVTASPPLRTHHGTWSNSNFDKAYAFAQHWKGVRERLHVEL